MADPLRKPLESDFSVEPFAEPALTGNTHRVPELELHDSVSELRVTVKDRLDVRRNAEEYSRRHLPQAAAAAAVVGLVFGWAIGGIFTA